MEKKVHLLNLQRPQSRRDCKYLGEWD